MRVELKKNTNFAKTYKHFIRTLYFLLIVFNVDAQSFHIQSISIDEGLPGSTVYAMEEDSIGYKWFATDAGLCRFDGVSFKTYGQSILKGNEVLNLFKVDNEIWFSDVNGKLYFLKNNKVVEFKEETLDKDLQIKTIFKGPRGRYWISSRSKKMYALRKNASFDYDLQDIYSTSISDNKFPVSNNQKELLISSISNQIIKFSYEKNRFESFNYRNKKKTNKEENLNFGYSLEAILSDPINKDLSYHDDSLTLFLNHFESLLYTAPITDIFTLNDSTKVLIINGSLCYYDPIKIIGEKINWFPHFINRVKKDREGNIWFLTRGKGIFILKATPFKEFNSENSNLENNHISDLKQNEEGKLFIGTAESWLSIKDKEEIKSFKIQENNLEFYDMLIIEDSVFLSLGYVKKFNLKTKKIDELAHYGKTIYKDKFNRYYIPSFSRLKIFKDFISDSRKTTLFPKIKIYHFLQPIENNILLAGTSKGLYYLDLRILECKDSILHDSFHIYQDAKGNSINHFVTGIEQAPDSTIYLCTRGAGVFIIKNKIIEHINSENGLTSNICTDLYIDKDLDLWVTTNKGLNKIDLKRKITTITKEDGLVSNETTTVTVIDNQVYVGTSKGLSQFNKHFIKASTAPSIFIRSVKVLNEQQKLESRYNLNYSQNNIQIEFIALSYFKKLNYKYRLVGHDDKWIDTDRNIARLNKIKPGSYTFEVIIDTNNEEITSVPQRIHFEISPPFWDALYFKISCFLILALAIGLLIKNRISNIRKKESAKSSINKKIAELELSALQSQMNPHFIFNVLNSIQNYILTEKAQDASQFLEKFASLMRLFLNASKSKFITLEDEIEILKLYIELEELRFEGRFKTVFEIDNNIDLDFEIPSVMIQPFVENAIKHGLASNKNGILQLMFNKTEHGIVCIIQDNGIGRERSLAINKMKNIKHKSHGTELVLDRIATFNNFEDCQTSIKSIDLFNEQNTAAGTRVEIQIIYLPNNVTRNKAL